MIRLLICSLTLCFLPYCALGDLVIYHNETDFLNALSKYATESFEDQPVTMQSSNPVVTPLLTLTPEAGILSVRNSPTGGHYPTHGSQYVEAGFNGNSLADRFDLKNRATAFGLTITDFGDQGPGFLFLRTNVGKAMGGLLVASAPLANGNELFFGFIQSTPFTSVRLYETTVNDGIGIDGVHMTIPEPGCLSVMFVLMLLPWRRQALKRSKGDCFACRWRTLDWSN